jgi:hypothetical protein
MRWHNQRSRAAANEVELAAFDHCVSTQPLSVPSTREQPCSTALLHPGKKAEPGVKVFISRPASRASRVLPALPRRLRGCARRCECSLGSRLALKPAKPLTAFFLDLITTLEDPLGERVGLGSRRSEGRFASHDLSLLERNTGVNGVTTAPA